MVLLDYERDMFEKKLRALRHNYGLFNKNNLIIFNEKVSLIEHYSSYEIAILLSNLERKKQINPKIWVNALVYMLKNDYFIFVENKKIDVFLSHSTKDKFFVKKFMSDLKINNIKSWIDEEKLNIGDVLSLKIKTAIKNSKYFIIFWSKNSDKSIWVRKELEYALEIEKTENNTILPVIIENCKIPEFFKDRLYADFRYSYLYAKSFKSVLKIISNKSEGKITSSYCSVKLNIRNTKENGARINAEVSSGESTVTIIKELIQWLYMVTSIIFHYLIDIVYGNVKIQYEGEDNKWIKKYHPLYYPILIKEDPDTIFLLNQGFFKAFIESRDIVTGQVLNKGKKYCGHFFIKSYNFDMTYSSHSDGVIYNDKFLIVSNKKIINAISINDGRLLWKKKTLNYFSEVVLIGDRIVFSECLSKKNTYSKIVCVDIDNNNIFETSYTLFLEEYKEVYPCTRNIILKNDYIVYITYNNELFVRCLITGKVVFNIYLKADNIIIASSEKYLAIATNPYKDIILYDYLRNCIVKKFTLSYMDKIEEISYFINFHLFDNRNLSFYVDNNFKVTIDIKSGTIKEPKELLGKNCVLERYKKDNAVFHLKKNIKKSLPSFLFNLFGLFILVMPFLTLELARQYVEYLNNITVYSISYVFLFILYGFLMALILEFWGY